MKKSRLFKNLNNQQKRRRFRRSANNPETDYVIKLIEKNLKNSEKTIETKNCRCSFIEGLNETEKPNLLVMIDNNKDRKVILNKLVARLIIEWKPKDKVGF